MTYALLTSETLRVDLLDNSPGVNVTMIHTEPVLIPRARTAYHNNNKGPCQSLNVAILGEVSITPALSRSLRSLNHKHIMLYSAGKRPRLQKSFQSRSRC